MIQHVATCHDNNWVIQHPPIYSEASTSRILACEKSNFSIDRSIVIIILILISDYSIVTQNRRRFLNRGRAKCQKNCNKEASRKAIKQLVQSHLNRGFRKTLFSILFSRISQYFVFSPRCNIRVCRKVHRPPDRPGLRLPRNPKC